MRFCLFLLLWMSVSIQFSLAQYQLDLHYLTTDDGLSQNVIMDLHEDERGYLWIGTRDGLNKFDGYSVETYKSALDDPDALSYNEIFNIYEDSRHRLWIGTRYGLNLYNRLHDHFEKIYVEDSNELIAVRSVTEHTDGKLYVLSDDGLYRFKESSGVLERVVDTSFLRVGEKKLFSMKDKLLLIDEPKEMVLFDPETQQFGTLTQVVENSNHVMSVVKINESEIYLANYDRLYHIDIETDSLLKTIEIDGDVSVLMYEQGILWAGTYGFNLFSVDLNQNYRVVRETRQFVDFNLVSTPRTILQTDEGVLWVGLNGLGISRLIPQNTQFGLLEYNSQKRNSLINNSIRTILPLTENLVYIGGYKGLERFNLETRENDPVYVRSLENRETSTRLNFDIIPYRMVKHAFLDSIIWIGTEGHGLARLNLDNGLIDVYPVSNEKYDRNVVADVFQDNTVLWTATQKGLYEFDTRSRRFVSENAVEGTLDYVFSTIEPFEEELWIGTHFSGIVRFNMVDRSVSTINFFEELDLPEDKVLDINRSVTGDTVWVGTRTGLYRLNREGDVQMRYSQKDGLPNETIYSLLTDKFGDLWMSTNNGISNLQIRQNRFVNYNTTDGLQSREFNTNAYASWKGEMIFMGGVQGLNYFKPEQIKRSESDFKVYVQELSSSSQTIKTDIVGDQTDSVFSFPYGDRDVRIRFSSPIFRNRNNSSFFYRISEVNEEWREVEGINGLLVQNLNPGMYTVSLKRSKSADVPEISATSFTLEIVPPFWMRTSVRAGALFLLLGFSGLWIRQKFQRLKREKLMAKSYAQKVLSFQEEERHRVSTALHDSIGNHLMLTKMKIRHLGEIDDSTLRVQKIQETEKILDESIQEVRSISHNLHPHLLEKIGITKTINSLVQSLNELSGIQIESHLEPVEDILKDEKALILFRFVQETLTNMVNHSEADTCRVELIKNERQIMYRLSDNGKGFSENAVMSEGISLGLQSLYERAEMLNAKLSIESQPAGGTTIRLELPL